MPRSSVAISFVCVCAGREVPRLCCDVRYVFGVLRCREHASLSSCDREARAPARVNAQHGIHAMADPRPAWHAYWCAEVAGSGGQLVAASS
jgi:hypothetical protein